MYSAITYTGDGATTDFAIPFPYLDESHVQVSVGGETAAFTFANSGTARISPAPGAGVTIVVQRNSSRAARIVDFTDSAVLTEDTLDKDSNQLFYLVQEALDQATTQSYFSTDANGARVINMADPVAVTDGATMGWVQDYVQALTTDGNDLLPLDNEWTGHNTYDGIVSIGTADFNPSETSTKDLLNLSKGLYVFNQTNNASQIGYGFAASVRRSSGLGLIVGAQLNSIGYGGYTGLNYGVALEAWKDNTSVGTTVGLESAVINLNGTDSKYERVGLDVVLKNREDNATVGGAAPNLLGQAGSGVSGNLYNANSWAIQISAQPRSDSGITRVGWNRGLRFRDEWCDIAAVSPYYTDLVYKPGDYVAAGGHVYECILPFPAANTAAPPNATYWTDLGAASTIKAVGIDFSGISATTASRMQAAIKLRGQLPIMWDTEQHITTDFDPLTTRWALKNDGTERFAVNVATGDLYVNGSVFAQGTKSSFSATRGGTPQTLSPGVWSVVVFPTEEYDDRGEFNPASSRFTAQAAGIYDINCQVQTETGAAAGHRMYAAIYKNGVLYKANFGAYVSDISAYSAPLNVKVRLNAGDYVSVYAFWNGPSNVAITGETSATFFQGTKL